MNRTEQVTLRLSSHILDVGILPMYLSKEAWAKAELEDPSNLHKPFGWAPPIAGDPDASHPENCSCYHCSNGDDPEVIWLPFCADIIAEQSAHLDDEQFSNYLDVITWTISMQITYRHLPWEEREALIDKQLVDDAEGSMRLLNEVQMAVLDTIR